jgi:hypothetical protein
MDAASLQLLTVLDGTRDVESIQKHLIEIGVTAPNGKPVEQSEIAGNINKMARSALLVA